MAFHENLGFINHPFVKTNADEEPLLNRYFVPPPFFDGVIGDPENPSPCIVLAPRGAGKTAQRRMVEGWSLKNKVLAVTYDRFEFSKGHKINETSLSYHIRNIIIRTLVAYLSFLADYPDLVSKLDKNKKKRLSVFVKSYLGDLTGDKIQELLKELRSLPERCKEFWTKNVGFLDSVVQFLLKTYDLEDIDLPDISQEEKSLTETYKHQLEILLELINTIGFNSIYILIDKLDETEKTGNDPEKTYDLMRPLVKDLELLGLRGFGFKFFVWDKVEPFFRHDARPDRVAQHKLNWSRKGLQEVLKRRLQAFSENKINSFSELMSEDPGYAIDEVLCLLANKSPRNMIRICEKIFTTQAEIDSESKRISPQAIEKGVLSYCEQITSELYGGEICKELQRVGRELFTINYLANDVFKTTHENTSRNRVTKWRSIGVVSQLGTISTQEAKRPLNLYYIADPAMCRLVCRSSGMERFIKDRWLICGNCREDNLIDISLYPEGNDPACCFCGHNLIQ